MRVLFFLFLVLMTSTTLLCQEYNASAAYNYTMFYNPNSASLYRHHAGADFKTDKLKYTLDVNSYTINYQMGAPFNHTAFENVLSMQGSVSYKLPVSQNWHLGLTFAPRFIWIRGQNINFDNVIPEGNVSFGRKLGENNKSSIAIGAAYSTAFGKPAIIPVLSYQASIRNFDISIGIPETTLSYNVTPKHSFGIWARASSFYTRSNGNYFYTQNGLQRQVIALQWVSISAGLGYQYKSEAGWDGNISVGKTLNNKLELLSYGNNYFESGFGKNLSISFGLNYKLNFKK